MPYKKYTLPQYPLKLDMWDILRGEDRPIVVYGMGNGADKLIARFGSLGIEIADFFASDGFVRGHSFHGKRVKSFSEIKELYSDFVIVLSFASNRKEVLDMLTNIDKSYDLYIPDMPVAGTEYFDKDFYNSNYQKILDAYNSFADEDSRNLFSAVVSHKLFGKGEYLFSSYSEEGEIYSFFKDSEVCVDAGAYNGDTCRAMLKYFPALGKIYAFEPDVRNYRKLKRFAEEGELCGVVEPYCAALWSECELGEFIGSANRNSSVNSTASHKSREESVRLISLDTLSLTNVDFIKYDVEGAELEALIGSAATIRASRPSLLVSAYHRSRDIFSLILYLKERYPFYEFYLRRTLCVPAWEIALIAIPKSR